MSHSTPPRAICVRRVKNGSQRFIDVEYPEDVTIDELKGATQSALTALYTEIARAELNKWVLRASFVANVLMLAAFYWR